MCVILFLHRKHITAIFLYFIFAGRWLRYGKACWDDAWAKMWNRKCPLAASHLTTKTITPNWFLPNTAASILRSVGILTKSFTRQFQMLINKIHMQIFRMFGGNRIRSTSKKQLKQFLIQNHKKSTFLAELEKFYPNYLFSSYINWSQWEFWPDFFFSHFRFCVYSFWSANRITLSENTRFIHIYWSREIHRALSFVAFVYLNETIHRSSSSSCRSSTISRERGDQKKNHYHHSRIQQWEGPLEII